MNVLATENMIKHLLVLLHMNTSQSSAQSDDQFFLSILSMISSPGKSFMNHLTWNYSIILYTWSFYQFAIHIQIQDLLLSWIILKFIILRYDILISIVLIIQELQEMCDEAGVRLEYLSSYSPDFNSIEKAFAELKTWIKKNYALMKVYDMFDQFLERALWYMSEKPGNHFHSCHITM